MSAEPKYALFAGSRYYPYGGAWDFRGVGSIEELKDLFASQWPEWGKETGRTEDPWAHIARLDTMEIVCWYREDRLGTGWEEGDCS